MLGERQNAKKKADALLAVKRKIGKDITAIPARKRTMKGKGKIKNIADKITYVLYARKSVFTEAKKLALIAERKAVRYEARILTNKERNTSKYQWQVREKLEKDF